MGPHRHQIGFDVLEYGAKKLLSRGVAKKDELGAAGG